MSATAPAAHMVAHHPRVGAHSCMTPVLMACGVVVVLAAVVIFVLMKKHKKPAASGFAQSYLAGGNNGSISCADYCSSNTNKEAPSGFTGAAATGAWTYGNLGSTTPTLQSVAIDTITDTPTLCLCQESNTPFTTGS